MNNQTDKKEKYIYLEVLRIIAIFFVIFNHTQYKGFFLFASMPIGSFKFWLYMFISVFCKFAVPVFFAISGALLLDEKKEITIKDIYVKRIPRYLMLLIIYSLFYYVHYLVKYAYSPDWHHFFELLYSSKVEYHLLFLYQYIAFLMILPFLKSLVKSLSDRSFIYLFILSIIINGILPILEFYLFNGVLSLNDALKLLGFLSTIVVYPSLGYYMHHRITREHAKTVLRILWPINLFSIVIVCMATYKRGILNNGFSDVSSQLFYPCFNEINCCTIFLTTKYLIVSKQFLPRIQFAVLSLSKCTLGIYLLHPWVKDQAFFNIWLAFLLQLHINPMLSIFFMCFVIMITTYAIVYIISKVPFLKKIV